MPASIPVKIYLISLLEKVLSGTALATLLLICFFQNLTGFGGLEKEDTLEMRNILFAKRAFTVGILAALFAAFLVGPAPVAAAGL